MKIELENQEWNHWQTDWDYRCELSDIILRCRPNKDIVAKNPYMVFEFTGTDFQSVRKTLACGVLIRNSGTNWKITKAKA